MSNSRQALVFCVSVLALSWCFELFIIVNGGIQRFGPAGIVALMCIPGALSLVLRIVMRLGFSDAGFRLGKARYYAYALGIPASIAALLICASVLLDVRQLAPVSSDQLHQMLPVLLSVAAFGLLGAVGEELGWRGFLQPKLAASVRHPYGLTAIVWAAWHFPLIAFGDFYRTDHPLLMASIYTIGIVAISFVLSEIRMRSQSVWTAAILHWAHNLIFQFVVPALILTAHGSRSDLWDAAIGDTGLAIAVMYACAYLLFRYAHAPRARSVHA